ncbi:MAG: 3-hydroxyacyl-CoA dehydrogenase NAD-binding domain-containing protein [Gemmataceae bacterium]
MAEFQRSNVIVERETDGAYSLRLEVPNRSVNVVSRQLLDDLDDTLTWLTEQQRRTVLVVRSGKKTGFLAGADLHEFSQITTAAQASAIAARGQAVFARLAALPMPSVAVIHGPCLGGGLELALACDYRLVFDRPDTQLGLPEIELGLLPAWGGTVRLPRVVGLERALAMILGGKRLSAPEALQWGLADTTANDERSLRREVESLLMQATLKGKVSRRWLPIRTWRQRLLESHFLGRRVIFQATERRVRARTPDDMPAPLEALETVRTGIRDGIEAGLVREQQAAARLGVSTACRNLVNLFLQREAARKLPADMGTPEPIRRVAVLGAGTMGAGIAQLLALSDREVVVWERDEPALAAGLDRIDVLFTKLVERGKATANRAAECRALIRGTTSLEFRQADLAIEAVIEDREIKKSLFCTLAVHSGILLATNTSSLRVADLNEVADPSRVAGLHFFNPVHKIPLVEVVQSSATRKEVTARLMRLVLELGKVPILVGDGPGFVVNAVLMPYLDEALHLLSEGMNVIQIDRLMQRFGMPMGPFALLDQIGLPTATHVAESLGQSSLARVILAGVRDLGGFYRNGKPNPEAERLTKAQATAPGSSLPLAARLAEARERLVLRMVHAALQLIAEGRVDAARLDLAMILGTGWAPHRGGPLTYARNRGAEEIARAMTSLHERYGQRFALPAEWERHLAS